MIISKTPYRVSFIGGGSDLPSFYNQHPGMVISHTLNKHVYVAVHPNFNAHKTTITYNRIETVKDINAIEHPIVRAALKKLNVHGVEISSTGDIPAQTGLGSSSSFAVGLLRALYAHKGTSITPEQLAHEACKIEMGIPGSPIGKQDQYAAAYGGLNQFIFNSDGSVKTIPIAMPGHKQKDIENSLLLFYTGKTRSATKVLHEQSKNLTHDQQKIKAMKTMVNMVPLLRAELEKGNIDSLGEYLHEGWRIKRSLASSISDPKIDDIYKKARRLGALGGKILGAGGGGFFLLYCQQKKQPGLIDGLGLRHIPVIFDSHGAQVVYAS